MTTSFPRTPQRFHGMQSPSHSFRTPAKTPSYQAKNQRSRSSIKVPRMSPSPCRFRTPHRSRSSRSSSGTPLTGGDRFIPSRRQMNLELCRRAMLAEDIEEIQDTNVPDSAQETPLQKEFKRRMLSSLCNVPLDSLDTNAEPKGLLSYSVGRQDQPSRQLQNPFAHDTLRVLQQSDSSLDPLAVSSSSSARNVQRKVPSAPSRILDAPDLVDDYYLNLISWGKDNILAVALGRCVYLWNATTGEIQHLVTVSGADDYITSVSWCTIPGHTKYIAVGTNSNVVQLWDSVSLRKVRTLTGHAGRVSSLVWSNQNWLTSGARDSLILQHDVRSSSHVVATYKGHEQEVCGLKWNDDGSTLASGGNENFLCLWDASMSGRNSRRHMQGSNSDMAPRLLLTQHKAAVKALDWCPFHRGLLASGGGTADRTIKFWNSSSGAMLSSIDTGSQVCSILWSKHQRELCSSHGYSENQLILWKYPTMTKIQEFKGHTSRVLNMEMSPDGRHVVSAAADETLRFWNIFGDPPSRPSSSGLGGDLTFGMPTIR